MSDCSHSTVFEGVRSIFPREKWANVRTMVAVSGGPDSVALIRVLMELSRIDGDHEHRNLIVAHVNHGTRGAESECDERFVRELAREFNLDCHVSAAGEMDHLSDGVSELSGNSSEEAMRDFRFERLQSMAQKLGARYLALGHHRDDQVETILFRIFRGTGIAGMGGIPAIRRVNDSLTLIRPFLGVPRADIHAYLDSIRQSYCVDRTNANSKPTRNFLRQEILPLIEGRFGDAVFESVANLGRQAREADRLIVNQFGPLDATVLARSHDQIEFDCCRLSRFPTFLVCRWLSSVWDDQEWPRQAMTYHWWTTIDAAIRNDVSGRTVLNIPANLRFEKRGTTASVYRNDS